MCLKNSKKSKVFGRDEDAHASLLTPNTAPILWEVWSFHHFNCWGKGGLRGTCVLIIFFLLQEYDYIPQLICIFNLFIKCSTMVSFL